MVLYCQTDSNVAVISCIYVTKPAHTQAPFLYASMHAASVVRCLPSASKFSTASQRSKAERSRGHSLSITENQSVSRVRLEQQM